MAVVAIAAGGDGRAGLRLGLAMTALQASIGALNDVVDAPRDAGRTPPKPIVSGLVSPGAARAAVVLGAMLGLVLAVPSGTGTVLLAGLVLAVGYGYDLVFKGTAWSWLPFAVGIPILPIFGWYGAVGVLPISFLVLVPVAIVAGAALAIANARADLDRDTASGVDSVARRLGSERAWRLNGSIMAVVIGAALVTMVLRGADGRWVAAAVVAAVVVAFGVVVGRGRDPRRLQRAWECEAVGCALLAAVWLAAVGVAT